MGLVIKTGGGKERSSKANPSEGEKKKVSCALARDRRPVETLGRGSSDVMGDVPV
jgi:hypothetical protein